MARDAKPDGGRFTIEQLQMMMELMEKHDVTEVRVQEGDAKCVLRRGVHMVAGPPLPAMAAPVAPPSTPPAAPLAESTGTAAAAPSSAEGLLQIKSPTVGTFYVSPSPGEAAFVQVGDSVKPDTVVCIVEAMKVFNQIPADLSGTIEKILVQDGDSVEYGQPMFLVRP